jgi:hypothetical protein
MICRIEFLDRVVLVGHNPPVVFATTAAHLAHQHKKPDGRYDRDELLSLAEKGQVTLYNEEVLRDVVEALPYLTFGCPEV